MPYNDDKLKINIIPIEKKTHKLLLDEANRLGLGINEFLGQKADEWASTLKPTEEELQDRERQIYWNRVRMERRRTNRLKLYRMAAEYCEDPTDENDLLLTEQCELLGKDRDTVVAKANRNPYSSAVAMSSKGTKFDACVTWFTQALVDKDGGIMVNVLKILAHSADYHWSMVNRVRDYLNNDLDTPYIESVREGRGWKWILRSEVQEDQQDQLQPII